MEACGPGRIVKPVGKQRFMAWEVVAEGKIEMVHKMVEWPGAGEVLVKVRAFGLSASDAAQRRGESGPPVGASGVLGQELAGEVMAVGAGADGWAEGDKLCCLVAGGACAEFCLCPARLCLRLPAGYTWQEAAAVPLAAATAWSFLVDQGGLRAGQAVAIHGAAGGVGHVMLQLAHARGLRVVATCGSAAKADFCRGRGADVCVDRSKEDFVRAVHDFTRGRGVEAVVDVGGVSPAANLRALALRGTLLQMGAPPREGGAGDLGLRELFEKQATVTGCALRAREPKYRQRLADAVLEEVWPLLDSRAIVPHIHKKVSFSDVPRALDEIDGREVMGKIVCIV